MPPHTLSKGANVGLLSAMGNVGVITVVIEAGGFGDNPGGPDASILLLGDNSKVRSNDDFIFYNQRTGADESVWLVDLDHETSSLGRGAVAVDLSRVPESISKIVIAASTDAASGPSFGDAKFARMWVAAATHPLEPLITYEVAETGPEHALIFGELYRRGAEWKMRAVGQGYTAGLAALVADFGVEVEDDTSDQLEPSPTDTAGTTEVVDVVLAVETSTIPMESNGAGKVLPAKVGLVKKKRPARIPAEWTRRTHPYLPVAAESPWQSARLFPAAGLKTSGDQETRATSVLLSVVEIVREFGRAIVSAVGGPTGRIETFTEVRFSVGGEDLRPDGLIRVTRGSNVWHALLEVKTGAGRLTVDQVESYLKIAKAKSFDAVITITTELTTADELPIDIDTRKYKSIKLRHLAWEEIVAEAAMIHCHGNVDETGCARVLGEFLQYGCDSRSGMLPFDDMGRHWTKVREAVKVRTISAADPGTIDVCHRFDQLSQHIALQLGALTGQRVMALPPSEPEDAVSRAQQLADSGELFGSLRIVGAASTVVLNANLSTGRIGCSMTTPAPKAGRPSTKVNWMVRQLAIASPKLRISAHHAGSRSDITPALLESVRTDPTTLLPPNSKDIREFTLSLEVSMGSKRAGSEGGFVKTFVDLSNTFYAEVVERVRNGREG